MNYERQIHEVNEQIISLEKKRKELKKQFRIATQEAAKIEAKAAAKAKARADLVVERDEDREGISKLHDVYSSHLSLRECEVLYYASRGFPSKIIGVKMSIAEKTVKFHLTNIYGFLGSKNRVEAAQAVYMALRSDYLPKGVEVSSASN